MIIRPLSFVFGAFTSLFLFYLCILNYEIAHRYVVASQSVLSNQCTPPSAGHINVTTSIGLDLDTNATSHLTEAETVPLESQISNATLCFEKILVVNLRERTDRRDTLTLTAAIGNIHLDFLPTVRGESVSPKARPNHWRTGNHNSSSAELENWRSHLTALRTIVENNYASALIIEDDAD